MAIGNQNGFLRTNTKEFPVLALSSHLYPTLSEKFLNWHGKKHEI